MEDPKVPFLQQLPHDVCRIGEDSPHLDAVPVHAELQPVSGANPQGSAHGRRKGDLKLPAPKQ